MTAHEINDEVLDGIFSNEDLVPAGISMKFVKRQTAGDRTFMVSGPKADKVRALIFAGLELTRKEIAGLADCSVSRVGEVVWGLEHDGIEFPEIPLRAIKAAAVEETDEVNETEDEDVKEDVSA